MAETSVPKPPRAKKPAAIKPAEPKVEVILPASATREVVGDEKKWKILLQVKVNGVIIEETKAYQVPGAVLIKATTTRGVAMYTVPFVNIYPNSNGDGGHYLAH